MKKRYLFSVLALVFVLSSCSNDSGGPPAAARSPQSRLQARQALPEAYGWMAVVTLGLRRLCTQLTR